MMAIALSQGLGSLSLQQRPTTSTPSHNVSSSGSAFSGRMRISVLPSVRVEECKRLKVSAIGKREELLVDIRKMSDEDIGTTVVELKGELFVLRCKQATRQELKTSDFRKIRKQIARMLTVRRERELVNGIKMRESRKLDREWKKNIVIKPPKSLESLSKSES